MDGPFVIKIGGHETANMGFLQDLATVIRKSERPVLIVHGGGKEISAMQHRLGIEPHYVDGVRITDLDSLAVVTMILCGTVNKRLVRALTSAGIDALGISGVDRNIIRATRMHHATIDMGFTGEVQKVRGELLCEMLRQGITPVIAPICSGEDSHYNVNADHVAGAVAAAVEAERVVFITNVEGVLVNDTVALTLSQNQAEELITGGTIVGGMIPKVNTALRALHDGVPRAVITNLLGMRTHGGTVFTRD